MTLALFVSGCKPPEQPAVISIVGAVLMDGTGGPPISDSVHHHRERAHSRGGRARESAGSAGSGEDRWRWEVRGAGPDRCAAPRRRGPGIHRRPGQNLPTPPWTRRGAKGAVVCRYRPRCATPAPWWTAASPVSCTLFAIPKPSIPPLLPACEICASLLFRCCAQERSEPVLAIAKRNTKRLADAGVPIAVGSGGDMQRELDLLVEAGLPPADVLLAATRNEAAALHELDETGRTIEPGKRAQPVIAPLANPAGEHSQSAKSRSGHARRAAVGGCPDLMPTARPIATGSRVCSCPGVQPRHLPIGPLEPWFR